MEEFKIKTCGTLIKDARILKNMTIEDLVFEINKRKKKGEKDIDKKTVISWETSKSYPELEMCYTLSYILDLNPTELLGLRNFERKKFKVKKRKRTFWNQDVPDEFFWFMKGIFGLASIMLVFYLILQFKKFESGYMNSDIEFEKTLVNSINNNVNQNEINNEYENRNEILENEINNEYKNRKEIEYNTVDKNY